MAVISEWLFATSPRYRYPPVKLKLLRQIGATLLLLVSCMTPAMACVTSGAQMTVEERACCLMMKSDCGQMEMPSSQDCCRKTLSSDRESALKTDTASFHPATFVIIWASSSKLLAPQSASNGWVQRPEHSPPKSPPSAITILRI